MSKGEFSTKDSGVPWLGDIPTHWEIKRLRYLVEKIGSGKTPKGGAEAYPLEGITFIRSQNVYDDGLRLDDVVFIDEEMDEDMASTRVRQNDVLLNITGASIGRCARVPKDFGPANVNQHVAIIRPDKRVIDQGFLHAFLCSLATKAAILADEVGSSREALNSDQIGALRLPLPSLSEQRAIAAFLDERTSRIDGLIARKKRLVQLLKERRQALITRAVTRGLDPTVQLKPSGVPWLGEVPVHWTFQRIRHCFRFQSGGTPSTTNEEYWIGDLPWVSAKDMKVLVLSDTEDHIAEHAVLESAANKVPPYTLLVLTRSGILQHTLPVSVNTRVMAINQDVKGCIPAVDINVLYAAYFIHGLQDQLLSIWRQEGATVESLEFETVKDTRMPLPPRPEQDRIVQYIQFSTTRIDALITKVEAVIERLQEYRSALISAAVTGKVVVPQQVVQAIGS